MNSMINKFSQQLTKNCLSLNSELFKTFSTSLIRNCNKNRLIVSPINYYLNPSSKSIYSQTAHGFFSSDSKNKEETKEEDSKKSSKSEEEKSEEKKSRKEDSDEEALKKEEYKELKNMYNDQLKASEQLKKKFEDVRKAYLDNVQETEQIKIRYDREVAQTKDYAITKFSKDILDVCDNFERALNSLNGVEFEKLKEEEKIDIHVTFLEGKYNYSNLLNL